VVQGALPLARPEETPEGVSRKRQYLYRLSPRSRARLEGVHTDLVLVVGRAISLSLVDFTVLEGVRLLDRQRVLVATGASRTMNSRHLTGHAVDLGAWIDGDVRWDWPLYGRIAQAMKEGAEEIGVAVEWGGDWTSFQDGPHFQLPWAAYPA
jgi:peptidoglycan L-alanyl-D-glutamate endopeptidase CwlK